jgi:regulator of protease activity HflC (stomatin/prohibitin superfamily)
MIMEILFIFFLALFISFVILSVKIVPQSQNYVIERLGRYHRTLEAGLHLIVPVVDVVRHKIDILERQLPSREISTITLDNVTITVKLAILYRIVDAAKSVYRIKGIEQAIQTTVIGVVRSVIGKTDLDGVQSNRRELSEVIEDDMRAVTQEWGIILSRVEIIDVDVDEETRKAMQMQLNAERTRRALVRTAEGEKEAAQLKADADLYTSQKLAEAKKMLADAEAYSVAVVAKAIADGGESAINFEIKKIQAEAIKTLGAQENTKIVLLPAELLETLSSVVQRVIGRS